MSLTRYLVTAILAQTYLNTDLGTSRQGAQGILDSASNAELDSEFGTHKVEDVVEKILQTGSIIQNKVSLIFGQRVKNIPLINNS